MIGDSNCYQQKGKGFVKMIATKMTHHLKTVRNLNGSICLTFKYYQTVIWF